MAKNKLARRATRPVNPKEQRRGERGDQAGHDWFVDEAAAALPDYGIPQLREKAKKRRRLTTLLKASIFAAPLALVLAFVAMGLSAQASNRASSIEGYQAVPALAVQEISSPGRFPATQALETWLATVPNPLPGGRLVSWDGAVEHGTLDSSVAANGTLTVTLEHFTVVDGAGTSYQVTYQVGSDPVGGGAAVLAGPSLMARPQPASGIDVDQLWAGLREADVTPTVEAAVQTWADAYVSGSPDRLHLAVGDTNQDRTYVPIAGATHVDTAVTLAGRTDAAPTAGTEETPADRMIARVELRIGWEGRDSDASPAVIQMDVLVLRAGTGAPQVVAWGAPGTGPQLNAYGNAVPALLRSEPGTTGPGSEIVYDDSGTAPEPAPTGEGPDGSGTDPGTPTG